MDASDATVVKGAPPPFYSLPPHTHTKVFVFQNPLVFKMAASPSGKPHTAGGQIQFPARLASKTTSKSSMSHISNVVFGEENWRPPCLWNLIIV